MKLNSGSTPAVTNQSMQSTQTASEVQQSEADLSCTAVFESTSDPATCVIPQMNALSASLENHQHADEECLESYLQQYMQRLTGKAQKEPAPKSRDAESAAAIVPTPVAESPAPEEPAERLSTQAPEHRD